MSNHLFTRRRTRMGHGHQKSARQTPGAAKEKDCGHIRGGDVISRIFGVSRRTLVAWAREGAPVAIVGKKYQANYRMLLQWLLERGETASGCAARRRERKQ